MPTDLFTGNVSPIDAVTATIEILGSGAISLLIALVYKWTHRGLTYSQSFQFSLVLLGMLGAVIMMVATGSLLRAIGILGAFSIIRFRTAIKDPKDMAFIMFVLAVGLAMGAQMYALAFVTTVIVIAFIFLLTKIDFGKNQRHESVIRILCTGVAHTIDYEAKLSSLVDSFHLLSAHTRADRMELSYGIQPKRGKTALSVMEAMRHQDGIDDVELFDAKNQLEF